MKQPNADTLEQLITSAMQADDWATVNDLEPRLDALSQPKPPATMLSAALWYAEQGLSVFPLQPGRKLPYKGSRGFKDASTDPDEIINWWTVEPHSNIGIATGHLIDVIDVDGPIGVTSWARMKHLPCSIGIVSTPRPGGNHLYIKASGRGNKAAIFPGVDYRGLGGYVVAPPSQLKETRNDNGEIEQYAGAYTWRRPLEIP